MVTNGKRYTSYIKNISANKNAIARQCIAYSTSKINKISYSNTKIIIFASLNFYFRFVWPTDLKSIPHASTPTSIIPNKFEVSSWYEHTLSSYRIAFLSADTSRDFVTLTFEHLTLNSSFAWRVTLPTFLPNLKTLRLSVFLLGVIKFPVDYH